MDNNGADDITDSAARFMSSAFTTITDMSKRGAKKTVKLTKNAAKAMHIDQLARLTTHVPRTKIMRSMNIRKAFKARHKRSLGTAAEVDDDSESSDSGEEFTDEQVQERVDKKYFDPSFNGMNTELSQLDISYADEDTEVGKEVEAIDALLKERQAQINVVNTTLKKRILRNYDIFIKGVMQINDVNEDLLKIGGECREGRMKLRQAKQSFVIDGLAIPINRRRRDNLRSVQDLVVQVQELHDKYTCLLAMLDARRFTESIAIAREPFIHADLEQLKKVHCMAEVIEQWEELTSTPPVIILSHIDACIEECTHYKFREDRYKDAMEASFALGDQENTINKVVVSLFQSPERTLFRAVSEVSLNKTESDDGLRGVMAGVEPEHLLLCFCQMSGKLADYLTAYSNVCRCHTNAVKHAEDDQYMEFHQTALSYVKTVGKKIGFNVHAKLVEILEGSNFAALDLEKVLHCFHIVMMLVEATVVLGCDKDSMAAARACVKRCLISYVSSTYQPQRGDHIATFMTSESWEGDNTLASNFRVVKPLSPDSYKSTVKKVKQYVSGTNPEAENPFYTEEFMQPPDISAGIDIVIFTPTPGRELVTTTSVHIANCVFEYVCRAAVRFPPLAGEVLDYCEELVSLYVYIAAANFISVSRNTPLEEQGDFSPAAREHLAEMRAMSLRAAPHLNKRTFDNHPMFPPPVFQSIEDKYGSAEDHFGLVHRLVSIEGSMPLITILKLALESVSPLLSFSVQKEKTKSIEALEQCCEELLHVGMHRLSSAIFSMEDWVSDISKTKFDRDEMKPSTYVAKIVTGIQNLYKKFNLNFPSEHLKDLFWKRFVFMIQFNMTHGYAKTSKKINDLAVSQMMVDVQSFTQRMKEFMPQGCFVLPDYTTNLLKAFFDDYEGRKLWLKNNHKLYQHSDLIYWLSTGDKEKKSELDHLLKDIGHTDNIPVTPFTTTASSGSSANGRSAKK